MNRLFRCPWPLLLSLVVVLLLANGCAQRVVYYPGGPAAERPGTSPQPEQQWPPSQVRPENVPSPRYGPAQTLYADAERAINRHEYRRAEMLLERVLRIEPANGWYWHAMGRVKYALHAYGQAIQFCLKSDSMAGRDTRLREANRTLLHQAREKIGPGGR